MTKIDIFILAKNKFTNFLSYTITNYSNIV